MSKNLKIIIATGLILLIVTQVILISFGVKFLMEGSILYGLFNIILNLIFLPMNVSNLIKLKSL